MKKVLKLVSPWEALLVVLLIASVIIGSSLSPYFLYENNLSNILSDLSEKSIMILSMMMIIVVGEIDLSVASILGLSSVVLGDLWMHSLPLWLCILVALAAGTLAGFINGLLVTTLGLPSLVVTLGTLALYRGCAYIVLGQLAVSNFPDGFTTFGFGDIPGTIIPWPFVIFVVLAVIVIFVLHGNWIGRQLYTIGNNQVAARFAGIRVARIKLTLFTISGFISGLAGVIFTARFSSARADNALGFELDVITIVLLGGVSIFGGRGTLPGVIIALFVVGVLRNAFALADYPTETQSIIVGGLLVFSVLGPNAIARLQEWFTRKHIVATITNYLQRSRSS
jgi:rhamnose transport system permease protein